VSFHVQFIESFEEVVGLPDNLSTEDVLPKPPSAPLPPPEQGPRRSARLACLKDDVLFTGESDKLAIPVDQEISSNKRERRALKKERRGLRRVIRSALECGRGVV
jgi:hypothetical protein